MVLPWEVPSCCLLATSQLGLFSRGGSKETWDLGLCLGEEARLEGATTIVSVQPSVPTGCPPSEALHCSPTARQLPCCLSCLPAWPPSLRVMLVTEGLVLGSLKGLSG